MMRAIRCVVLLTSSAISIGCFGGGGDSSAGGAGSGGSGGDSATGRTGGTGGTTGGGGAAGDSIVAAAGKGGTGTTGGAGGTPAREVPDPLPEAEFAAAYVSAICDSIVPCCFSYDIPFDGEVCTTGQQGFLTMGESMKAQGATYDPVRAAICVAGTRARFQACDDDRPPPTPPECQTIYTGTVQTGGDCTATFECEQTDAGISVCITWSEPEPPGPPDDGMAGGPATMTETVQLCQLQRIGSEGDTCTSWHQAGSVPPPAEVTVCDASQGLHCDSESERCVGRGSVGARCMHTFDCEEGLYCSGTCQAPGATGTNCDAGYQACSDGFICNLSNRLCEPGPAVGDACRVDSDCGSSKCEDGTCLPPLILVGESICNGTPS